MNQDEALRAACDQLGISVEEGRGYLEHMFWACSDVEAEELWAGISTGKGKFKRFVKEAVRVGLIRRYETYSLVGGCWSGGDVESVRDFVTVAEEREQRAAKAKASMDWYEKAEEMRQQLWFPQLAQQMLDLYINEAKHRERTWSAVVNEFYTPMLSLQERGFPRDVVMKALMEAVRHNIWNPMYALAVAKSEFERQEKEKDKLIGSASDTFTTEDGQVCGEYDTWCLRDERYRERYISLFGEPDA